MHTNMHWIDWGIVAVLLIGLTWLTLATKKYVRGVADFLAANRLAGRYLLTVAAVGGGAISIIAQWEMLYAAGLPTQWWGMMSIPLGLMISLTGFIIYRFRQTRALTLAQFFEVRYSRNFRFFAGLLSWISGVLNYGIFPMITARFMIYFFGLPDSWSLIGWNVPMYPTIMAAYLGFALFIALTGGQITIMITDFVEGMVTLVIFTGLMLYIMHQFSWNDIMGGLALAPESKSMINPFKTRDVEDFNLWFFLIGVFGAVFNARSWQGNSGYNASARTPHEAKMAGVLSSWRHMARSLAMLLIPLAAYAVMHLPKYSALAAGINADLAALPSDQIRTQMTVPLFLTHILPVGLMGLFAIIIVTSAISCDNTYMHAWGTIFVQDVVLPWRGKPFTPRTHIRLLRLSIVGVGVFGFLWSLWFPLTQFINMYFAITGAIYLGGAGAVIIGGLYWNRGTTLAAWISMISGTVLAVTGLLIQSFWASDIVPMLQHYWPDSAWLAKNAAKFPINSQVMYFYAMLTAVVTYVGVSLLGPRHVYDMDKLLHRGKYAVTSDQVVGAKAPKRRSWQQLIGITPEFTKGDRILSWSTFFWSMGWWATFLTGTFIALVWGISDFAWSWFWWIKVWLSAVLGLGVTFWFLWGGYRDLKHLFRDLQDAGRDTSDDGTVKASDKAEITAAAEKSA